MERKNYKKEILKRSKMIEENVFKKLKSCPLYKNLKHSKDLFSPWDFYLIDKKNKIIKLFELKSVIKFNKSFKTLGIGIDKVSKINENYYKIFNDDDNKYIESGYKLLFFYVCDINGIIGFNKLGSFQDIRDKLKKGILKIEKRNNDKLNKDMKMLLIKYEDIRIFNYQDIFFKYEKYLKDNSIEETFEISSFLDLKKSNIRELDNFIKFFNDKKIIIYKNLSYYNVQEKLCNKKKIIEVRGFGEEDF